MIARAASLWRRLRALGRRRRLERDLEEELALHRALLAERGGPRTLGDDLRLREATRAAWQFPWLESLGQDLNYAVRGLRRSPGFTLAVVLTLALGIGAGSAIFSLAYGVLWKPLPYPNAARIVAVRQAKGIYRDMQNSSADIAAARSERLGLSVWSIYRFESATLTGAGDPAQLWGAEAESSLLPLLGARMLAGRGLDPSDDRPSAIPVVVIAERLWRARWGARPDLIGRTIQLEGKPYVVVGVVGAPFDFPGETSAFYADAPVYWRAWQEPSEGWGNRDVGAVARLAPGVTAIQAQQRLGAAMQVLAKSHATDAGWSFVLTPLREHMVRDAALELWMMLGVVGLVLLIAASNVACLLLARTQRRARELATRAALGASRGRILRQLAVEAALLVSLGGAAGLATAALGVAWLRSAAPGDLPRVADVGMSWPVVGFAAAISLLLFLGCKTSFSLSPFFKTGFSLSPFFKTGFGPSSPQPRPASSRIAFALMPVTQLVLALMLLASAGLLLKAFNRMLAVPLGFSPAHTLTFDLSLPPSRYPDSAAIGRFYQTAQARLAALPGVSVAAVGSFLPLVGEVSTGYSLPGHPLAPGFGDAQQSGFNAVDPDFFPALRIAVLAGRGLSASDTATAPPVAVISQAMARAVFRGQNPLGKRIQFSWGKEPWRTIVGVVADVRFSLGPQPAAPAPMAYVPLAQRSWNPTEASFLLRAPDSAEADPQALLSAARRAVLALDPEMPLLRPRPLAVDYADAVAGPRFRGYLVAGFAALALLLTAVGIYGVLAYSVGGRTREFGVRAALGARPEQVLALVLRQTLRLLGLGVALGLAGALLVTRLLSPLLFGVSPTDPWVLALTAVLLAAVGLAAAWAPARRAMAVDAAQALRWE